MKRITSKNGYYYYQVAKAPKWVLKEAKKVMLSDPIWTSGGKMDLKGKTYRYIVIKKRTPADAHPDDVPIHIYKRRRGVEKRTDHEVSDTGEKDFLPVLYNI